LDVGWDAGEDLACAGLDTLLLGRLGVLGDGRVARHIILRGLFESVMISCVGLLKTGETSSDLEGE
jgi:hypothetical protein